MQKPSNSSYAFANFIIFSKYKLGKVKDIFFVYKGSRSGKKDGTLETFERFGS